MNDSEHNRTAVRWKALAVPERKATPTHKTKGRAGLTYLSFIGSNHVQITTLTLQNHYHHLVQIQESDTYLKEYCIE